MSRAIVENVRITKEGGHRMVQFFDRKVERVREMNIWYLETRSGYPEQVKTTYLSRARCLEKKRRTANSLI